MDRILWRVVFSLKRVASRLTNLSNRLSSWRMGKTWLQTTGFHSYYNGRHFTVPGCKCNDSKIVVVEHPGTSILYKRCECTGWNHPSYIGIVYGNDAIAFKIKQLGIKT